MFWKVRNMLLNPRQEQILNFIRSYPSSQLLTAGEIAQGVGLDSVAAVYGYLEDLEVMGFIECQPYSYMTVRVRFADE